MANRKSRKQYKRKQNKTKQNKYLKYKKGGGFDELPQKTKDTLLPIYKSIDELIKTIKEIREKHELFFMVIRFRPSADEIFPEFKKDDFYLIQSNPEDKNEFDMFSNRTLDTTKSTYYSRDKESSYAGFGEFNKVFINEDTDKIKNNPYSISITRLFQNNIIHEFDNNPLNSSALKPQNLGNMRISRASFSVSFFEGKFFNVKPDPYTKIIADYSHSMNNKRLDEIGDDLLIPLRNCNCNNDNDSTSNNTSTNSSPPKKSWLPSLPFLNKKK